MERPADVTDEHLEYLDELREEGTMNMYGASPYVAKMFGLDIILARKIHGYWMESFGDDDR